MRAWMEALTDGIVASVSAADGVDTVWRGPAIASVKTSASMHDGRSRSGGASQKVHVERWGRTLLHGE